MTFQSDVGDFNVGNSDITYAGGPVNLAKLVNMVVASLPAPDSTLNNVTGIVSDSTVSAAAGWGNVVVGGGSNAVPVTCNGTDWLIGV